MKNYLITNSNDPCYPILRDLEARQITKSDFAKMTGFKKQTLGRWLSGDCIPKFDVLVTMVVALGYDHIEVKLRR